VAVAEVKFILCNAIKCEMRNATAIAANFEIHTPNSIDGNSEDTDMYKVHVHSH